MLNFETAAELAAAEGIEIRSVTIADDVAVQDSTWPAGRRGVGGTVLLGRCWQGAVSVALATLEAARTAHRRPVADRKRGPWLTV